MKTVICHSVIVLSLMYLVFFCIDRVNTAMAFINNDITKALLLLLCALSVFNACVILSSQREKARRRRQRQRANRRVR